MAASTTTTSYYCIVPLLRIIVLSTTVHEATKKKRRKYDENACTRVNPLMHVACSSPQGLKMLGVEQCTPGKRTTFFVPQWQNPFSLCRHSPELGMYTCYGVRLKTSLQAPPINTYMLLKARRVGALLSYIRLHV